MDDALPHGDFKIKRIKEKYDLTDDVDRSSCIEEAVQMLSKLKPVDADIYLKKLAADLDVSEGAIRRQLNSSKDSNGEHRFLYAENSDIKTEMINQVEKTLLKLIMIDKKYADFPEDIKGKTFTSPAGKSIFKALESIDEDSYPLTLEKISSVVDPDYLKYVDEIMEQAISSEREQQTYAECIQYIRTRILKERAEDINSQIEMGDGILSNEQTLELMTELVEIQKKLIG